MDSSPLTKAFYAIGSIVLSVSVIYWMISTLDSHAKSHIKGHLESPNFGPFDEAMAKSAGMEKILAEKQKKWQGFDFENSRIEVKSLDSGYSSLFQDSQPSFSSIGD